MALDDHRNGFALQHEGEIVSQIRCCVMVWLKFDRHNHMCCLRYQPSYIQKILLQRKDTQQQALQCEKYRSRVQSKVIDGIVSRSYIS